MSEKLLAGRFPHGQVDDYPLSSSSYEASSIDGLTNAADLFTEGATASTTIAHPDGLPGSDALLLSGLEPLGAATTAVEASPYTRLEREAQAVRLIGILPSTDSGIIRCDLTTHLLAQAPNYTALSYTWGRPDPDCRIELNGLAVPVRKNLWRFLQSIQLSNTDRNKLFWIDALCIDQLNLAERTHQVGLMSKIYSSAEQVLAWLGPAYGDSDLALQTLSKWASTKIVADADIAKIWWKPQGAALRRLCERHYWSRLWILQELVLAKEVQLACGSKRAPGVALSKFLLRARTLPPTSHRDINLEYEPTMDSRAMSILKQMQRARGEACLLDQMRDSQNLRCHEPRDKVYALLGIVGRGHEGIVPDYALGLPSLLNAVLRNHHRYRSAKDLLDVKRQCQELCEAVGVPVATMFILEDQRDKRAPPGAVVNHTRLIDFESGLTLWWAHLYGHHGAADMLESKLGQEAIDAHLVQSTRDGNLDVIQFWLNTGLGIASCKDKRGQTLIAVATSHGHVAITQVLLDGSDIDVNSRDDTGKAAIHAAASLGLTEVLKVLLALPKTNVNLHDQELCTPLHLATKFNRGYSIQLLLERPDLDVNLVSQQLYTPIEFALHRENVKAITMLLGRDDVDITPAEWNFNWHSPIHQSIRMKDDRSLRLLLDRPGVNVNYLSVGGHRALNEALKQGTATAITMLMSHQDIDLRLQDSAGDTPLHLAVRHDHVLVIIELLRMYCYLGVFPASLSLLSTRAALEYHDPTSIKLTDAKDVDSTDAKHCYKFSTTRMLSAYGNWSTPAFSMKSADELRPHHKIDINTKNNRGIAALHEAILNGRNKAASLLLSMPGIEVNLAGRSGETALHMAAANANEIIVKLLLSHKNIDVDIRNHGGLTAMDIAKRGGHTRIIKLLTGFSQSTESSSSTNDRNLLDLAWDAWINEDIAATLTKKDAARPSASFRSGGYVESAEAAAEREWFHKGNFGVSNRSHFPG